jgi:hypothetical protein
MSSALRGIASDYDLGDRDMSAVTFAENMLDDSALSTFNYDRFLDSLDNQILQNGVVF